MCFQNSNKHFPIIEVRTIKTSAKPQQASTRQILRINYFTNPETKKIALERRRDSNHRHRLAPPSCQSRESKSLHETSAVGKGQFKLNWNQIRMKLARNFLLEKNTNQNENIHSPRMRGTLTPIHGNKVLLVEESLELFGINFLDDRLGVLVATLGPRLVRFRPRDGVHGA